MISKFTHAAALGGTISLAGSATFAAASDYAFEPLTAEMKKGDQVRLVSAPLQENSRTFQRSPELTRFQGSSSKEHHRGCRLR
jgi:hypothetical protein